MELLARFELATRLYEIMDFMETSRPQIEILSAGADRADEVASSRTPYIQKKAHPNRMGFLLELLARFELAAGFPKSLAFREPFRPQIEIELPSAIHG